MKQFSVISVVAQDATIIIAGVISRILGCFEQLPDVTKTAQYFNASADKKEAHDQPYGRCLQPDNVSQSKSTALASLEAASRFDEYPPNVVPWKKAMQAYDATTKLVVMLTPKKKYVAIYDRAFQTVALLAADPTVKQEQINQALAGVIVKSGKEN